MQVEKRRQTKSVSTAAAKKFMNKLDGVDSKRHLFTTMVCVEDGRIGGRGNAGSRCRLRLRD